MSMGKWIIGTVAGVHMLLASAAAGPFRDGESLLSEAYADYRAALFQTNQKDKGATEASLARFSQKWSALAASWAQLPPPQYADDPQLAATLAEVARIATDANRLAKEGKLAESHEALEGIRDVIASLRIRNGVTSFSDRMNAYHEVMEQLLAKTQPVPQAVSEQAAILAYILREMRSNPPTGADPAQFTALFQPLEASVHSLQVAARSGETTAISAALKALKPAYSRMFLRYG